MTISRLSQRAARDAASSIAQMEIAGSLKGSRHVLAGWDRKFVRR